MAHLNAFSASGVRPAFWVLLSLICVAVDYWAGPQIQFPIVYLVPVTMASWYSGRVWGLALAVALPLIRPLYYVTNVWEPPSSMIESTANAGIRLAVFVLFALLVDRTARQMRDLRSMAVLEAMLGVCSECKRVHDHGTDAWETLESYAARHPREFRPSVCPACALRHADVFARR